MARNRSIPRSVAVRGARRQSIWLDFPFTSFAIGGGSTALALFQLGASGLALSPFTIVRTRITIHQRSDVDAAFEDQILAIGLAVVSAQAVAIGITAMPTPVTDLASDLWFGLGFGMTSVGSHTGAGSAANFGRQWEIDSKAMRKVEDGDQVVMNAETTSFSDGVTFFVGGRMLVKLH